MEFKNDRDEIIFSWIIYGGIIVFLLVILFILGLGGYMLYNLFQAIAEMGWS